MSRPTDRPRPTLIMTSAAQDMRGAGEAAGQGHRASSPSPTSAGAAATSRRCSCCPIFWPSRRRARPAPSRPGWWTTTALSPKAPRPTPGSWTRTGTVVTRDLSQRHPARRHPPDHAGSGRATRSMKVVERKFTVAEAQGGARSLHVLGHRARRCPVVAIDGKSDRRRRAGPADPPHPGALCRAKRASKS